MAGGACMVGAHVWHVGMCGGGHAWKGHEWWGGRAYVSMGVEACMVGGTCVAGGACIL